MNIASELFLIVMQGEAGLPVQKGSNICRRYLGLLPGIAYYSATGVLIAGQKAL